MGPGMMGFGRFGRSALADNMLTPYLVFFAVMACVLVILYIKEKAISAKAQDDCRSLKDELHSIKTRPEKHEFRIERFELIWFPTVLATSYDRMITGVTAGVPHCRKCLTALLLEQGEWSCRQCKTKHPESLGDLAVIDTIAQQALSWFLERHPTYKRGQALKG